MDRRLSCVQNSNTSRIDESLKNANTEKNGTPKGRTTHFWKTLFNLFHIRYKQSKFITLGVWTTRFFSGSKWVNGLMASYSNFGIKWGTKMLSVQKSSVFFLLNHSLPRFVSKAKWCVMHDRLLCASLLLQKKKMPVESRCATKRLHIYFFTLIHRSFFKTASNGCKEHTLLQWGIEDCSLLWKYEMIHDWSLYTLQSTIILRSFCQIKRRNRQSLLFAVI